jgi:integrase
MGTRRGLELTFGPPATLAIGEMVLSRPHAARAGATHVALVLSPDEVARLIAAAGNLKHQTALSVAYGIGLRASEVVALKVGDVASA